ncbi:hypothetical protein BCR37DRAFT_375443 [Protomyces lactucae-debilis]|uniref:ER membrane protein complex subunit 2 n=1 Tax=Protomyces lactucae-debilis TaxID=2754530 RepID=A0A1Y2FU85_PROLT|nr:uncharacterized protein BCR37DRAFT_375443 [Protomyces lactucae-debilis]ORY87581.1 hypothetical protein BCR37DRAFT_375443 [Protomyces lactucae-debilis]
MLDLEELRRRRQHARLSDDPAEVAATVQSLINSGKISSTGIEQWDLYEQGMVAALIVADDSLALECLTRLSDKFPESARVHALKGMHLEATKDADAALAFYNKVLAVEPTNVPVIKRRITLFKSTGKVGDAIQALCTYVDVFYTDADAWAELAELYASVNAHERANFCYGEAVLLAPHESMTHLLYADSFYTLAIQHPGSNHMEHALREYLRAIELRDNSLRAFCGVKVCCSALMGDLKETTAVELKKLDLLATKQLAQLTSKGLAGAQEVEFAKSLLGQAQLVK